MDFSDMRWKPSRTGAFCQENFYGDNIMKWQNIAVVVGADDNYILFLNAHRVNSKSEHILTGLENAHIVGSNNGFKVATQP